MVLDSEKGGTVQEKEVPVPCLGALICSGVRFTCTGHYLTTRHCLTIRARLCGPLESWIWQSKGKHYALVIVLFWVIDICGGGAYVVQHMSRFRRSRVPGRGIGLETRGR